MYLSQIGLDKKDVSKMIKSNNKFAKILRDIVAWIIITSTWIILIVDYIGIKYFNNQLTNINYTWYYVVGMIIYPILWVGLMVVDYDDTWG
jgi:hypothetical protein